MKETEKQLRKQTTERRNFMSRKNIAKKSGLFMLAVIMAMGMCSAAAFAGESAAGSVSVQITSGEHGTVSGKSGSFTETVTSGEDLTLRCAAEDGYVISAVTVNDAQLAYEDLDGIIGEKEADLTLEEVTMDLSLTVNFAAADEDEALDDETITDEGSEAGSEDTEAGDEELIFSDSEDQEALEAEGSIDEPGSLSTGEENAEEVLTDDSGKTGGEETEDGQDTEEASDEPATTDGSEGKADPGAEDQSADEQEQTEDTEESKTGKEAGKTDEGKDSSDSEQETEPVYEDESPKTGDDFPMSVILIMLSSLCTLAGIALHALLKHHSADA